MRDTPVIKNFDRFVQYQEAFASGDLRRVVALLEGPPAEAPAPITEDTVRQWMANQRCALWGRAYDLFQPESKEALVRDVLQLIKELEEVRDTNA